MVQTCYFVRRVAPVRVERMTLRPYNDPSYRRAKAALKRSVVSCQLQLDGCTGHATTLDHQPRLRDHQHQRGAHCCVLVPACVHCNSSDGATAGNRTRASGYSWP